MLLTIEFDNVDKSALVYSPAAVLNASAPYLNKFGLSCKALTNASATSVVD